MAHAVHPNYAGRHEPRHKPVLNGGPVIKTNSQQRYATCARTAALFRALCQQAEVPVQQSSATELGVPVVRKSPSDAFFHDVSGAEQALRMRFDPATWLAGVDLRPYVEFETCAPAQDGVVCDGRVEWTCTAGEAPVSRDCSATGDRQCDLAQPSGYCTVPGCEANGCPSEAMCVSFDAHAPRLRRRAARRLKLHVVRSDELLRLIGPEKDRTGILGDIPTLNGALERIFPQCLPELPDAKRARYVDTLGISAYNEQGKPTTLYVDDVSISDQPMK